MGEGVGGWGLPLATAYVTALAFDHQAPDPSLGDPGWMAAFTLAAGIHGLGPFLGRRIEEGEIGLPEPMASWLIEQARRNRVRLARMRDELEQLLDELGRARIRAVPLKGAAMLLGDLDDLAWRPLSDLDLLVPDVDDRELDLALAQAGYCLKRASWKHRHYTSCTPGPPVVVDDGEHPDNPRDVETHPAVVEMFRGFRWDLTRVVLADLGDREAVPVPGARAMAIHLGVHASIALLEGTSRAIHLIDLARALDRSGAEPVILAARDAGLTYHARFIYPAVALAARETGNQQCQEVSIALEPFVSPAMRDWIASVSLFDVSWAGRDSRRALDRQALWAVSRWDPARMIMRTLLPSPAVLATDGHERDGVLAGPRSYVRHYRGLLRRMTGSRTARPR